MSRPPRGLAGRAVGYFAVRDLIPLYAVYALLFSDHGLSTGEVSSLLAIWSVTAFVIEVPSGAWADVVSRRALLVLSSLLYAAGFSLWTAVPSYAAFAAGFVLWGISGALMSGTFQALLYDELAVHGAASHYARLMGWANSLAMVATLVGTALAAPLFAIGGYVLVGWVSVGIALVQAVLALSLPAAPRVAEADETHVVGSPEIRGSLVNRYVAMLRSGLAEVLRQRLVRHAVLIVSMLGLLAFDEYLPLVARENGAATETVPLLVALTVAGPAIGTALAGRTAHMRGRTMAWALAAAAILIAIGAAEGRWLGFLAIGAGFGIAGNVTIVAEARLQDAITGPARATVTSVSGLLSEVFAVAVFAAFALGSVWHAVSTMVTVLTVPILLIAVLVPRWLPTSGAAAARDDAVKAVS
ncbi:MAG TPA: MFS transporter [Jiangellaceae bacterium]|nr:MFS transporter [Jiangellaceae bacterium]